MAGRRRLLGGTGAVLALAVLSAFGHAAATPPLAPTTPGVVAPGQTAEVGIRIALVEQHYAFGPDESIHLVYRLTGDLASLELAPPPPATTTTTLAPETTTTIAAAETAPVEPGAATTDTAAATPAPPTTAVPTTTVPPPEPLGLVVRVTNYPAFASDTTARDIDRLVGGDVNRNAFGDNAIDGIEIGDARSVITFDTDGAALLTLDVPTDSGTSVGERLKFDAPGLYPVRTELLAATGQGGLLPVATHGTIVQRLAGPAATASTPRPLDLSVITAIRPGDAAAAARFDEAVGLAADVDGPVTIDAPPPVVAEAASTDDGAAALAEALTGDEFTSVPAVPLDVSSAVAVDRADEFARLLSAGEDMLTAAVPTTPSRRNTWIVLEPLSSAGAQELRDLGVRLLVMSQDMYRATIDDELPATDLLATVALPDGGTLPLLVVDSISDDLTADATDEILSTSTAIEWAVETITSMLVDDTARLDRSRVLSTPDIGVPDPRLLQGLEALAATTPSVEFTLASTLTGTTDVQAVGGQPLVVDLPADAGPSLAERVALIDATALSAASAGSMLPADDPRPQRWADELGALLTTAIDDDEAAAVAADVQAEADAVRDAVVPPTPFTFTLTGRSGDIEVQVGNTSPDPLAVILRMSSPKLSFPDSTPPDADPGATDTGDHQVTLRPNDETSLIIPVRAKSNGTSPIRVEVLTPAGESIAEPVTITSRVTAFTGLGQVLTAAFVLVLLSWWFAHWRGKRRAALEQGRDRHPSAAP